MSTEPTALKERWRRMARTPDEYIPAGALGRIAAVIAAPIGEVMRARRARGESAVLGPLAKMVLVAVANHAGGEDATCWAGMDLLERETGADRRSLSRAVQVLEQIGLLRVTRRNRTAGQAVTRRVTVYAIDFDALNALNALDPDSRPEPDRACDSLSHAPAPDSRPEPDRACDSLSHEHGTVCPMSMGQDCARNKEELLPIENPPLPPLPGGARAESLRSDEVEALVPPPDCTWRCYHARPHRDHAAYRREISALPDGWTLERLHAAMRRYADAVRRGVVQSPMTLRGWLTSGCHTAPEWDAGAAAVQASPAEPASSSARAAVQAELREETEALDETAQRYAHVPDAMVRCLVQQVLAARGQACIARLPQYRDPRSRASLRVLSGIRQDEMPDATRGMVLPAEVAQTC